MRVVLEGKLTMRDHEAFKRMLESIEGGPGRPLVLDLAGLDFVDSAGLGMFLLAQELMRSKGASVILSRPRPHVRRLLEVACFDTLFTIE